MPVRIHPSFLLVAAVIIYSPQRPLSSSVAWVAAVLISVLWHEAGHAAALKSFGYEPEIDLLHIFGLTTAPGAERLSKSQQFLVAAAGPAAGLLLAGVFFAMGGHLPPYYIGVVTLADRLFFINLVLSVANLFPVFPLDGGRMMKSLVEMAAPDRGAVVAHGISLVAVCGGLWFAMTHELTFCALMLLLLGSMNLTAMRIGTRQNG